MNAKRMQVLLPTLGSAGDVHPMIALGRALRDRGHRVTLLTNPFFRDVIERQGLEFLPVGSIEDATAVMADPNLWHPYKGFDVVARRVMIPAIAQVYRLIERHAGPDTVVAASGISLGARIAQEKLGVPMATVHLQPAIIRSLIEPGMVGTVRLSAAQPLWLKRTFFRLLDWAAIDRLLKPPVNEFRATLGLTPVNRVLHRWIHSPQCVIGFFPAWFAAPQGDWPAHTHLVGFVLWDAGDGLAAMPPEARDFLETGAAPIVVTPGSAAATLRRFFAESVDAVRQLGARAMLVTNFPQQLPHDLPANVRAFGYLPFSQLLPRAALLVCHGGIGTLAQAVKAGIPQLVVPGSHDQFDNGWRVERLGLGLAIAQSRYRAGRAAGAMRALLDDGLIRRRVRDHAATMDSAGALERACELLEGLAV